jgi:hypothetical protein
MTSNFEIVERDGKRYYRIPPNASRMVRGMGKLSYKFEEAIADLIDNSIAAGASIVDVVVGTRVGNRVYVHVLDNGHGIHSDLLPAAIQYGASDRQDDSSLGVYGFGLKTACQSFTSSFTVVSRSEGEVEPHAIVFDEDLINSYNDFLFETITPSARHKRLLEEFCDSAAGTLVVIENANRFFTSEESARDERVAQRFVDKRIKDLKRHLRKVYQRFLDVEDSRAKTVVIRVNEESLIHWDPFCLKEGLEPESEKKHLGLRTVSGKVGDVQIRGYILPSKVEFEDQSLAEDAEIGPNTHGVYVYRENRLIEPATYFGLFKRETHLANLRVEFSYDGALDELFHTALQKGSMSLGDLEEAVRDFLRPLIREADQRSRGKSRRKNTQDLHESSQKRIAAAQARIAQAEITAIDGKTATVKSKYGDVVLAIPSGTDALEVLPINPVDSIDDGQLWQLRLHNNRQVVDVNKGHDFYSKVYLPNRANSIAIQGLDMVFWALAITEANCAIPEYQRQFREFRYEVSRILREIVESLPEPRLDESDD